MNQPKKQERLSPGQLLRRARASKKWSVEDVSQRLKLSTAVIKTVEQDDYDLNNDVYRRGYAIAYAKLLGLDLDQFNAVLGEKNQPATPLPTALTGPPLSHRAERFLKFATYALGTAVIAVPLVWSLTEGAANLFTKSTQRVGGEDNLALDPSPHDTQRSVNSGAADNKAQPAHLSASVAPLNGIRQRGNFDEADSNRSTREPKPGAALDAYAADAINIDSANGLLTDLPMTAPLAEPPALDETFAPPTTDASASLSLGEASTASIDDAADDTAPPALRLSLQSDSWVEITDAEGQRLEYNLLRGGSVHQYQGHAPYRILIGRATGVMLEHAGEVVDLAPHIRGNVASFQLAAKTATDNAIDE